MSKVDVSMNGIELQDREFVAAIREGREPNASVAQVLPCYRTLDELERQLAGGRRDAAAVGESNAGRAGRLDALALRPPCPTPGTAPSARALVPEQDER